MDEKGTMTASFEPTLDVWRMLRGKPTEYVVVNPVTVEARFKDGEVRRYPQEIRELIVRCRDCGMCGPDGFCDLLQRHVCPDGFCAWGEGGEA